MPKGSRSSQCLSQSLLLDVHRCTIDQLTRLPAEVLRLHLSSRHLVTSGNKSLMAQRLYHALHNANHSFSIVTTTLPPVPTSPTLTHNVVVIHYGIIHAIDNSPTSKLDTTDYVNVCSHAYYPASSCHFRSFISARIAAAADLSHEPSNPTSYSCCSQPNSTHNTQSVTCHYSGCTFHT